MPHEIHSPVYEALRLFLGEQWDIYRLLLRVCRKKPGRAVVHGLRTSLRRLGAGLAVLGELVELKGVAQLRKEFKAELHSLRDLRDSQVQQKAMKGQNDSKMIAEFRASLKKRCRRQQTCARKRLKRAKAAKLGYCMLKIEEVLVACGQDARRSHNAASQLEHMLEREFKALQACVQHAKASDPASMHATRIQFKKYRYLWQVAEPSIPLPLAVARRMKTVQTQLG
ncbi:MAG: CHAD domain-containing protein, partial [Deltaproteobacteria bacterium]|nr:CHAD domain-containing protein [Deltaproteobacteria bacterium]